MSGRGRALLVVAVAGAAALWWWYASPSVEREIRGRLHALVAELNAGTAEGFDSLARAARIGRFFTEDVVVELGHGSPPIRGRDTLIGMATRLQPRTAGFVVELDDVSVQVVTGELAEASLTAVIRRRSTVSKEESIDAREFSAELRHDDGDWRVSRVVAVDTFR